MLDMYEQCKYKIQIINKKEKITWGKIHITHDMQTKIKSHSNINNKKKEIK